MEEVFMATRTINGVTLALMRGNIVEVQADAIVNAANSGLRGGGGVDGAIHRAGGPSIMEECRKIGGCPTGSAVATTAGEVPAENVFHRVGPAIHRPGVEEPPFISAFQGCFGLGEHNELGSIAIPSISTGVL